MTPTVSRRALAGLVFLLPPLALIAPLAMAPGLMLMVACVLLPWLWTTRGAALAPLRHDPLAWTVAALALWGAATLLWSPLPAQGATLLPRVVLVALSGLLLARLLWSADPATRRLAGGALAGGLAAALLWLAIDMLLLDLTLTAHLTGHHAMPENVPKRGLSLLAVILWPAALWLGRRRWWLAAAAVAATAAVILASSAGAAKLGLVVGAVVFAAGWRLPRLSGRVLGVAFALAVLVQPYVLPPVVDGLDLVAHSEGSTRHRLVIWSFAAEHARERPLLGWGFNMSRSLPGGDAIDPITGGEYIPLHPHSAPLQWWLEMGVVGAVIGGALLVLLARRAASLPPAATGRATALATLSAAMAVSWVGYGAWQLWWLSALAITAGLVAAGTRE
jgi:O-antigen ligase